MVLIYIIVTDETKQDPKSVRAASFLNKAQILP